MYKIGTLFRHEIYISWTAGLLALFYMSMFSQNAAAAAYGVILILATFFSILVHELGHAVIATRHGLGPCKIILHGLGGAAIHRRGKSEAEVQVSLAGPAAGIAFGILVWLISEFLIKDPSPLLSGAINWLLYVNLAWSVVNLLPIYPLDGGHVSESLLKNHYGREKGQQVTALVSGLTLGIALYLAYLYLNYTPGMLTLYLIVIIAYQNWNLYNGQSGTGGFGGY